MGLLKLFKKKEKHLQKESHLLKSPTEYKDEIQRKAKEQEQNQQVKYLFGGFRDRDTRAIFIPKPSIKIKNKRLKKQLSHG